MRNFLSRELFSESFISDYENMMLFVPTSVFFSLVAISASPALAIYKTTIESKPWKLKPI